MSNIPNKGAQDAIRAVGVDPRNVLKGGISRHGYQEIQVDADGERVYGGNGKLVTKFVPWFKAPDPWDILEGLDLD